MSTITDLKDVSAELKQELVRQSIRDYDENGKVVTDTQVAEETATSTTYVNRIRERMAVEGEIEYSQNLPTHFKKQLVAELLLEAKRYTQVDIANEVGLSRKTVRKFEREHPTDEALEQYVDKIEKKKLRSSKGSVYLIKHELGPIKIGVSRAPWARLRSLQVGSPFELEVKSTIRTNVPELLEEYLHQRYDDSRIRGEWFELSEQEEEYLVNTESVSEDEIVEDRF